MSFEGKVVLITGASSGIGADAAIHLAKLGASVSIVGRNEKRLNDVAEKIKNSGSPAPLVVVADVTKEAEKIVDETIKKFGKLDVLVNNAGVILPDTVENFDLKKFDGTFGINVRGVIMLTKLCVPHLEKTEGNIVNVSSIAGLKVVPNTLSYGMSKAALDQFTKFCALEVAKKKIRCNSINPAVIRTSIVETVGLTDEKRSERMIEARGSKYPLGRICEVSDTSSAIAFLADSKAASFLTGILLTVDGGNMLGLKP